MSPVPSYLGFDGSTEDGRHDDAAVDVGAIGELVVGFGVREKREFFEKGSHLLARRRKLHGFFLLFKK